MSPVFLISLPFVLLFLMSQGAGTGKASTSKDSKGSAYEDGDIIIIRRKSDKK